MADPTQGHGTATNQDRDTGMAPSQSTRPQGGPSNKELLREQAADHPAKRDGGAARQRSRLDPEASGMPEVGED